MEENLFFKYVAVTIYGTQILLLQVLLVQGSKSENDLAHYHTIFLTRMPNATAYKLKYYLEYLTTNRLITFDATQATYEVSSQGKRFLKEFHALGLTWDKQSG